jgi:glycosyltransferase involved in cell wall biosynthesis
MKTLRVAFVTNLCPYYRRPLYKLLAERMEITFYFFSEGNEAYLGSAIQHEPDDLPVREVRRITIAGNPLLVGLERDLRPDSYDVVVKDLNGRLMVPYVYRLARRRGLPFVLWTGMWHHPRTLAHRLTRPLVEGVYRGADAIVTYGSHVKRFVECVPGAAGEKIFIAGQAIDTTPYSAVEPTFGTPPIILFIGQLEAHKGVDDLITAFRAVKDDSARLRLVGSGSSEPRILGAARLDPRIDVLGHVPHADIPAQLAHARCLVLPSVTTKRYREPWGLVVNEAMAAGVPVIATDAVGAAAGGLVQHGQNGLVVPERTPEMLAAAIRKLVVDAELARTLGMQARRDVAAFSYERMSDAFFNAVEHAIATKSRPDSARVDPRSQVDP